MSHDPEDSLYAIPFLSISTVIYICHKQTTSDLTSIIFFHLVIAHHSNNNALTTNICAVSTNVVP